MKINILLYITFLTFIPFIISEATFEIEEISHMETQCDRHNGYFKFVILGKGSGFSDEIRITLPLEHPKGCKAVCMVTKEKMFCTMDSFVYDLSGEKRLVVSAEEPKFDNLKIKNWVEFFKPEHRTLNSATNCPSDERVVEPDEGVDEIIFTAYDAENIEALGCFRDKNNFSFELTKLKDEDEIFPWLDKLHEDIYFDIQFEKPENEKALCVISRKRRHSVYKVRCAIDYGGEIEIGGEADGTVKINGKKHKVVFRGLLVPPTVIDEC